MSHLSKTLKQLMAKRSWKAADLNRMNPKLLNSFLSRIIRGDQVNIGEDRLAMLAQCFHPDMQTKKGRNTSKDSAQVIAAYCRDHCKGPGADLVSIKVA